MIDAGIVYGSKEMAVPVWYGKDLVYVPTDIKEVETLLSIVGLRLL